MTKNMKNYVNFLEVSALGREIYIFNKKPQKK
jgi:hypothetical protein